MGRTKKNAAAAPEDVQEPGTVPEGVEAPPEGCGKIIGPEDEAELLGCQDEPPDDPPSQYAVTASPGLNLREEPSKAAPIITELPHGVGLFPTGVTQGAWCEVTTGRLTGWVLGEFLEPLWD